MRHFYLLLIVSLSLLGCKTNQMKNKLREGRWVEQYVQDGASYKSIGSYKKGDPIKKWRYYLDGKIIKREKYNGNTCKTIFYHENGKIQSRGISKIDTTGKYAHWYYSGDWLYYNENGTLNTIRSYNNGELLSETEIK